MTRLKHLLVLNDGGTWGNDPDGRDDVVVLRSTDIALDGSWAINDPAIRSVPRHERSVKRLREGDLVVVKSSGSPAHLGKTALVTSSVASSDPCFANFVQRLRPAESAEPRYVWYLLNSSFASSQLGALGTTTTGLRNLNGEILGQLIVPVGTAADQREIADFLDAETARIDALIERKRSAMVLVDERLRAWVVDRILRGLDPVSGVGDLPAGWSRARLGIAITLHRGFDLPDESRRNGMVPVISSGGRSGVHDKAACAPPGVVTGRYGTVGGVHFVDEPYWPLNTTLFVSDFKGNDARWVYYVLQVSPLDIDADKSAVTGINRNVVGALFVPVPPVDEQCSIAGELDGDSAVAGSVRSRVERQIALLAEHRQALITAAVTGQLDLAKAAA